MTANWIAAAGAAIFFILGFLHLVYAFQDLKRPRRFTPAEPGLLEALQATTIRMRKDAKNFWLSSLGFHFSHSVGVLFYALTVIYCALARPDILNDVVVRVAIVGFGASWVLMARAFWFIIPLVGSALGVSLIAIGMAMMSPG
jgi:hypothetical protein